MKKILRPKRKNDLRRSDSSQIQEELGLEPTFPDLRYNALSYTMTSSFKLTKHMQTTTVS